MPAGYSRDIAIVMRGSRKFRQGGPGQSDKKSSDSVFFFFFFLVLSLLYRSQMVNFKENYHFQEGGGGPIAYSL